MYVPAVDEQSSKLYLPAACVSKTAGSQKALLQLCTGTNHHRADNFDPPALICRLFQQSRCRQGSKCNHIHADTEAVKRLRGEKLASPPCCVTHRHTPGRSSAAPPQSSADEVHHEFMRCVVLEFGSDVELPVERCDVTDGLTLALRGNLLPLLDAKMTCQDANLQHAAATIPLRSRIKCSAEQLCRNHNPSIFDALLHLQKSHVQSQDYISASRDVSFSSGRRAAVGGLCRFGDSCKFIHVCHDVNANTIAQWRCRRAARMIHPLASLHPDTRVSSDTEENAIGRMPEAMERFVSVPASCGAEGRPSAPLFALLDVSGWSCSGCRSEALQLQRPRTAAVAQIFHCSLSSTTHPFLARSAFGSDDATSGGCTSIAEGSMAMASDARQTTSLSTCSGSSTSIAAAAVIATSVRYEYRHSPYTPATPTARRPLFS